MKKTILALVIALAGFSANAQQTFSETVVCDYLAILAAPSTNHSVDALWLNVLSVSNQDIYTGFVSAENKSMVPSSSGLLTVTFSKDGKNFELNLAKDFYVLTEEFNGEKIAVKRNCTINNLPL